ncbi:tail fiber domain-containing protein [Paraburkholderia kirstenboschensis]|uniref:Tail fiber domain-containing protein n=1 Tax=Paraburkholderia kirstenboschensis TaxID=1245436 RepID=A0ABZ0ET84_9BURK|nr:tail fiber domain-containing protein [Paraburkholderia kirstenboschensis]WOD19844.1 tail fiber domain-containing protein [Paraburkholderia kirstenboschensis]
MTSLQKVVLGTAPTGTDGDAVRTAFTKINSNVDVFNSQAALASATGITSAQALTVAHVGKRINIALASAGVINLPAASACGADNVLLLRNIGATVVTLAITAGSGDTVALSKLNPGESALMDTDGIHAWNVITRGRSNSDNEVVNGNCTVGGSETVGGNLSVTGTLTQTGLATLTGGASFGASSQATISSAGAYSGTGLTLTGAQARIVGDFSSGGKNQTLLQTSAANGGTTVGAIPNGTGSTAGFYSWNAADPTNAKFLAMYTSGAGSYIYSGGAGSSINTGNPLYFFVASQSTFAMMVDPSGNVNIGPSQTSITPGLTVSSSANYASLAIRNNLAPAGKYWLVGPNAANNIVVFNQGAGGCYIVDGSTSWAGQSDSRLKNVRSSLTGVLDAVISISTVRYTWKSDDDHAEALGEANDSRVHIGVIAQDVQAHFPEIVDVVDPEKGYIGVQYPQLATVAIAAIKELKGQLDAALARIAVLEAK